MTITLIATSLIALLLLFLSVCVIRMRQRTKTSLGTGNDRALERAARAHGNLTEYAPVCLLLIGLLEYARAHSGLVLALAVAFIVGRVCHAYGLAFSANEVSPFRIIGTALTLLVLIVGAIGGLFLAYG